MLTNSSKENNTGKMLSVSWRSIRFLCCVAVITVLLVALTTVDIRKEMSAPLAPLSRQTLRSLESPQRQDKYDDGEMSSTNTTKSFISNLADTFVSNIHHVAETFVPNIGHISKALQQNTTKRFGLKHVGLLKVHKAGSTTLQNMLFRFGLRHDLDVLLPKKGNYLYTATAAIEKPKSGHFDIFAVHTIYSKKLFDAILPSDATNVAIVRNPLDRMISAAFYYRDVFGFGYLKRIPKQNFINNLIKRQDVYDPKPFSYTRNSMGRDFGFPASVNINQTTRITSILRDLDHEFSLVMVMERFDESLVMLRRLMGWSLLDILYLRVNSHTHVPVTLKPAETETFKKTCFLDYAIYDFFVERFDEKVKNMGQDFHDEVTNFNAALEKVKVFCGRQQGDVLHIAETQWYAGIAVPRSECTLMKKAEPVFINELRKRQAKRTARKNFERT